MILLFTNMRARARAPMQASMVHAHAHVHGHDHNISVRMTRYIYARWFNLEPRTESRGKDVVSGQVRLKIMTRFKSDSRASTRPSSRQPEPEKPVPRLLLQLQRVKTLKEDRPTELEGIVVHCAFGCAGSKLGGCVSMHAHSPLSLGCVAFSFLYKTKCDDCKLMGWCEERCK